MIEVQNWEWQPFPYTDGDWAALHIPAKNAITNLSEVFDEIEYLPLTAGRFLMRVDGDIWLVELKSNPQMGTYLWSIYSLIPDAAMGEAQWEFAPYLSSRTPVFQFRFDMEHTEISSACETGQLVEFNFGNRGSGSVLAFPAGEPISWSPSNEEYKMADTAIIRFTIHEGDSTPYHGTIYIETSEDTDIGRIYTASLVGTGLHLMPDPVYGGGGIITAVNN